MMAGTLRRLEEAGPKIYPEAVQRVLEFLARQNWSSVPDGTLETPVPDVICKVFEGTTEAFSKRIPETHLKNVDIHCLIRGKELQGFSPLSGDAEVTRADPGQDNIFYQMPAERLSLLMMHPGDFSIYFPWDLHVAMAAEKGGEKIRKAVVKVPLILMQ